MNIVRINKNNNTIVLYDNEIYYGIKFNDIDQSIKDHISKIIDPNKYINGNFTINNIKFYNLIGSLTVYFRNNRLDSIGFSPIINENIIDIKNKFENEIKKYFNVISCTCNGKSIVFENNKLYIFSTLTRNEDYYSISIHFE